ncbi:rha-1, partial [Symbiodinium pilosum]
SCPGRWGGGCGVRASSTVDSRTCLGMAGRRRPRGSTRDTVTSCTRSFWSSWRSSQS